MSQTFSRSERARDLLRHLVEFEQAGKSEQLKGFSIGVDVFGKDAEFDPTTDAVVRVQAGRLRELLSLYYGEEGVQDLLRISIPRGGYVPVYEWHGRVPEPVAPPPVISPAQADVSRPAVVPPPPASPRIGRQMAMLWCAVAATAGLMGLTFFRSLDHPEPLYTPVTTSHEYTGAVETTGVPTASVTMETDTQSARTVVSVIATALSAYETVDLVEEDQATARLSDAHHFDFVVEPAPAGGDVLVRIDHRQSGVVLLSRVLDEASLKPDRINDTVADLLSSVVPASGILYSFLERRRLQRGVPECLIRYDDFFQDMVEERFKAAYDCFEGLARNATMPAIVYAQLSSLQVQGVVDGLPMPAGAGIGTARELAVQAVRTDPISPAAHRAFGYLHSLTGNPDEAVRWMKKAHELNSFDLGMAAAYGYALLSAGDYRQAGKILRHAVETSSAHSTWWDYSLFISALMSGEPEAAYRASEALTTPGRAHYMAARLIGAQRTGRVDEVVELRRQMLRDFPDFAANPRTALAARHTAQSIINALVSALAEAGVGRTEG